jgi:sugar phosphate isomerase/epimerase
MSLTRRSFVALSAALPFILKSSSWASKSIPVGLEMYSVREELKKDPEATVRAVAKMGYQGLEFYAPYFDWTEAQTKSMRKLLDDLGIRCYSTHNDEKFLQPDNIQRARDMNVILGSKYIVQAWADPKGGLDQWKTIADNLNAATEKVESAGLKIGYHNHHAEFTPVEGKRPIEIIAKNTKPTVMLQLDVGTCLEAGSDPVAWIRANPGRIRSMHCKDWSSDPAKGYKVLLGEGSADWKKIFDAAESVGGLEYYLVEQEGSQYSELESAKRSLEAFKQKHRS